MALFTLDAKRRQSERGSVTDSDRQSSQPGRQCHPNPNAFLAYGESHTRSNQNVTGETILPNAYASSTYLDIWQIEGYA